MRESIFCPSCSEKFWVFGNPDVTSCPNCGVGFVLRVPPPPTLRRLEEYDSGIDLLSLTIAEELRRAVPRSVAVSVPVLPLELRSDGLSVAIPEESGIDSFDKATFMLNRDLVGFLAPEDEIRMAIARNYEAR